MKEILTKFNAILTTKRVSFSLIILNIISIIFGVFYITVGGYNILWDILGVILIITLLGNYVLVYLNSLRVNRSESKGNILNLLCYCYLIFSILAMFWIIYGNFTITMTYSNDSILGYRYIYAGYFGNLIFALIIAIYTCFQKSVINNFNSKG